MGRPRGHIHGFVHDGPICPRVFIFPRMLRLVPSPIFTSSQTVLTVNAGGARGMLSLHSRFIPSGDAAWGRHRGMKRGRVRSRPAPGCSYQPPRSLSFRARRRGISASPAVCIGVARAGRAARRHVRLEGNAVSPRPEAPPCAPTHPPRLMPLHGAIGHGRDPSPRLGMTKWGWLGTAKRGRLAMI